MIEEPAERRARILIVDDDERVLRSLSRILRGAGYDVVPQNDPLDAIPLVEGDDALDVAIVDLMMPNLDGLELCERIRRRRPALEVVVMTAFGSIENAVKAMRAGAFDFLTKPFPSNDAVLIVVEKAVERRRLLDRTRYLERQIDMQARFENIVGQAPRMIEIFRLIETVAATDATVLLLGESGTGKELVARAVHERSARARRPFLAHNCSALTETLLEAELFGHAKGAFTGAVASRRGLFEEAHGGTLFLDEIGDVAQATQVRLLRALQEGEVKPVGSSETRKVDVRVVAATNVDLEKAVAEGRFREDLFYRLNVVSVELPPLRERRDDIPLLAMHFLSRLARRRGLTPPEVAPEVIRRLGEHDWPGNVRELENAIERALVVSRGGPITLDHLPPALGRGPERKPRRAADLDRPFSEARRAVIERFERGYLEDVLKRAEGNMAEAARLAGVDRSNLRRLLVRYRLDPAAPR
jgi:two-component system, NtrC family, response regulator HydG